MLICKKCGKEFPKYSENNLKEVYKDCSPWIQKQIIKSYKKNKNLGLDCSETISHRLLLLCSVLIFCIGVITIVLGILYQSFFFFIYAGLFFIGSVLWYYYFYKKDIISKYFKKH